MLAKMLFRVFKRTCPADHRESLRRGYDFLASEDYVSAKSVATEILSSLPNSADAMLLMAQAMAATGQTQPALAHVNQCIAAAPRHADAYYIRGLIYESGSDIEGALADYTRVLALNDKHLAALHRKGALHDGRGEFGASLACAQRLVELDDQNADAFHNFGIALRELGRLTDAEKALRAALALAPHFHLAEAHLALVLMELGRFADAELILSRLMTHAPHELEVRWGVAVLQLLKGHYDLGWMHYEARATRRDASMQIDGIPEWDGRAVQNGALLIHGEQGLGDQIMFASCIHDVLELAPGCVISCDARLEALFRRSFPGARIVSMQDSRSGLANATLGPISMQTMLGSLPLQFRRSVERFPRHHGYLLPASDAVASWREELQKLGHGPKVGISWTGGTAKTRRNVRSLSLEQLAPVLRVPGCNFVDLQYIDSREEIEQFEDRHGVLVHRFPDAIGDYDQTAALVGALDLVISVCTAVVHLSGALGKQVWILVPTIPEWRYRLEGEGMPWYPSARLWRQSRDGDWSDVIQSLAKALETFCQRQTEWASGDYSHRDR